MGTDMCFQMVQMTVQDSKRASPPTFGSPLLLVSPDDSPKLDLIESPDDFVFEDLVTREGALPDDECRLCVIAVKGNPVLIYWNPDLAEKRQVYEDSKPHFKEFGMDFVFEAQKKEDLDEDKFLGAVEEYLSHRL